MRLDLTTFAHAQLAAQEAARQFLYDPNVNLIDFGYPIHGGELDENDLSIRIHVRQKLSRVALEAAAERGVTQPIPAMIGGFKTDVPEGKYRLHRWGWWGNYQPRTEARAARAEIMRGGLSISNEYQYTYGTLGGLVYDRATGAEMILSNWHVLVGRWSARPGQRIYQAGTGDGGTYADTVATLTRNAMSFNLDAAVAKLNGSRRLLNDQLELGPVTGVGRAELGMHVKKSGRKSEVTYGRVVALEGVARMNYDRVDRVIRNVVTIEPQPGYDQVSMGGDSGSWWLDEKTMRVVGLHFAGSDVPERALANDMSSVLEALNVDVAV